MKTTTPNLTVSRVPISIRIETELAKLLDDASAATGFTKTELIEQAVREHAPALILERIHQRQEEMRLLEEKYAPHPASEKNRAAVERAVVGGKHKRPAVRRD